MNERDIEIEDQCWEDFGEGEYYLNHEKFASLIRADEREACAETVEGLPTWITNAAASSAIRARGNT